jgi:hypothetical protein
MHNVIRGLGKYWERSHSMERVGEDLEELLFKR